MDMMKELMRLNEQGALNDIQKLWFRKTKDAEELYDTKTDPYELNNIAKDPANASVLSKLRTELTKWMEQMDDKGFIPEQDFIQSMWPGMIQPATAAPEFSRTGTEVSINSSTPGNSISWQLLVKGQKPVDNAWQIYTAPIKISNGQELYAVAERIGYKGSTIKSFHLTNN
jgi:hypothetical protein